MRIATTTFTPNMQPTSSTEMVDFVPPSQLFEMAASRFEAAIATSRIGGVGTSPSAIVSIMAVQQIEAGMKSLRSINIPTTPFMVRTQAARAIDQAKDAAELLRSYHERVVTLGDGAHPNHTLPSDTVALVEDARERLETAVAIARRRA